MNTVNVKDEISDLYETDMTEICHCDRTLFHAVKGGFKVNHSSRHQLSEVFDSHHSVSYACTGDIVSRVILYSYHNVSNMYNLIRNINTQNNHGNKNEPELK